MWPFHQGVRWRLCRPCENHGAPHGHTRQTDQRRTALQTAQVYRWTSKDLRTAASRECLHTARSVNQFKNTHFFIYHRRYVQLSVLLSHTTQELPEKWKSVRKIAFTVKHEVAPLQSNEVSVIRRKCFRFEVRLCVIGVGCQSGKELNIWHIKPLSCIIYMKPTQCLQNDRQKGRGRYALILNLLWFHTLGQTAWVQRTISFRVNL